MNDIIKYCEEKKKCKYFCYNHTLHREARDWGKAYFCTLKGENNLVSIFEKNRDLNCPDSKPIGK